MGMRALHPGNEIITSWPQCSNAKELNNYAEPHINKARSLCFSCPQPSVHIWYVKVCTGSNGNYDTLEEKKLVYIHNVLLITIHNFDFPQ